MKASKVRLAKTTRFQQNHRQRISHHQHRRGRRGGREVERAGLALDRGIQRHLAEARERRIGVSREGDKFYVEALDEWQQVDQLSGFARVRESQHRIAIREQAQIPVQRVLRIQHHRRGPGRVKRRGDFMADVTRFADADDHQLTTTIQRLLKNLDRLDHALIQAAGHPAQTIDLCSNHVTRTR